MRRIPAERPGPREARPARISPLTRPTGLPQGWEIGGSYGQGGTYYLHAPTGKYVAFRPREVAPTLRPPAGTADEVQAQAQEQTLPSGIMNPLAMGAVSTTGAASNPAPPAAAVRPRSTPCPLAPLTLPPARPAASGRSLPSTRRLSACEECCRRSPTQGAPGYVRCPIGVPAGPELTTQPRRQAHQWQSRFLELDVARRELRYARHEPSAEDEAALHAASAATRVRAMARAGGGDGAGAGPASCVALPLPWLTHVEYHPGKRQGRRITLAVAVPPDVQSVAGARDGPSAGSSRGGLHRSLQRQRRRRQSGETGDAPPPAASGPQEDELLSALARSAPTEEARGRAKAAARSRQGSRRDTEASLDSVELQAAVVDDAASVGTSPSEASFATGIGGPVTASADGSGAAAAAREAAVARTWTGRPDVRLYSSSSLDLMAHSKEVAATWVDALAGVCMRQQLAAELLQRVVRRHLRGVARLHRGRPHSVLTPLVPIGARFRPQRSSAAAASAASTQARAARRASLATFAARATTAAPTQHQGPGRSEIPKAGGPPGQQRRRPTNVLRFARRSSTVPAGGAPAQAEASSGRVASAARIAAARRASVAPPSAAAPLPSATQEPFQEEGDAPIACLVQERKRGSEALGAAQLAWLDLRRDDSDTAWFLASLPFGSDPEDTAAAQRRVQVESGAGRPADVASRLRDDTCAFGAVRLVVAGHFKVRNPQRAPPGAVCPMNPLSASLAAQFVFFTWAAPRVRPVERGRARVLAHAFRQGTEVSPAACPSLACLCSLCAHTYKPLRRRAGRWTSTSAVPAT